MLHNGSEMYNNLNLGENSSRYINGHVQMATGSATQKDIKCKNGKMVPNKEDLPTPSSPHSVDNKLKFADRLEVLFKTGSGLVDNGMEPDDPYAFSEPEPQVYRLHQNVPSPNNTYSRKCVPVSQEMSKIADTRKTFVERGIISNGQVNGHSITQLYPALSASLGHSLPSGLVNNISSETKVADDCSSKTMNRLQAKIARNKVIGKHKKVRPSSRNSNSSSHITKHISPKKERSLLEEQLLGIKTEFSVKKEPEDNIPKSYKPQQHGSSHLVMTSIPAKRRRSLMASRHNATPWHEALQRIRLARDSVRDYHQDLYPLGVDVSESEGSDGEDEVGIFQKHWFSGWQDQSDSHRRDSRVGLVRTEMRRRLLQLSNGVTRSHDHTRNDLTKSIINTARVHPSQVASYLQMETKRCRASRVKRNRSKTAMLVKRVCSFKKGEDEACSSQALPCTHHCLQHIMYNVDQLLFEYCTAKFSDNTQCCVPVFDICHELPLCIEHARKRDNYDKMCAEIKPKKVRKKAKPSAMTRPNKRGRKKRKIPKSVDTPVIVTESFKPSQQPEFSEMDMDNLCGDNNFDMYIKEEIVESFTDPEIMKDDHPVVGVEEVLAMAGLPLDPVELATQASRLLEEHDLTNVLNQIPADAFNDLFTEDKNGTYEPTREETEELERALEAVDKDVKSLEKLSQTQGLLETLMDDHSLAHTLAQLPEVPSLAVPGIVPVFTSYHNGYAGSNSAIMTHSRKCTEPLVLNASLLSPNISMQSQTNMPS